MNESTIAIVHPSSENRSTSTQPGKRLQTSLMMTRALKEEAHIQAIKEGRSFSDLVEDAVVAYLSTKTPIAS
jgi:hypothetical protein